MAQLKKGSKEAKARMAKLRAMRKPKKKKTSGKKVTFKSKGKTVSFYASKRK
jgi:hypothetical protein